MTREARILQKLRKKGWKFGTERSRKTFGRMNHDDKFVKVNPVGHIVATIIHELIHVEYPKLPEGVVVALELERRREITCKDEDEILLAFSPDLYRVLKQIQAIRGGL